MSEATEPKPEQVPVPVPVPVPVEHSNGNGNGNSTVWGVSIRGWISIVVVLTVCAMSGASMEVTEPLYSMVLISMGFYFGQKSK